MKNPRVVVILENFNGKKRTTIVGTPKEFHVSYGLISTYFDPTIGRAAVKKHGNPQINLQIDGRKITEIV